MYLFIKNSPDITADYDYLASLIAQYRLDLTLVPCEFNGDKAVIEMLAQAGESQALLWDNNNAKTFNKKTFNKKMPDDNAKDNNTQNNKAQKSEGLSIKPLSLDDLLNDSLSKPNPFTHNTLTLLALDNHQSNSQLLKVSNEWQNLQRRIVRAGRKNELLLQACKLNAGAVVIDGTAGFGVDSLLLASTGASVLLCEQNPVLSLLLIVSWHALKEHPHWHKLLGRCQIYADNFLTLTSSYADCVYLDPMFPNASFDAKVGKSMQVLHTMVAPPSFDEERALLHHARQMLSPSGCVVVKRPLSAPFLAQTPPKQSWQNSAIRFDKYCF